MAGEVTLRVHRSIAGDIGRSIARLPIDVMRALKIEPGDYIEIIGYRSIYAKVFPENIKEKYINLIRIDESTRKSAGVEVGDEVRVRRAELRPAMQIALAPLWSIRADPHLLRLTTMLGRPATRGQWMSVYFFGEILRFIVLWVKPDPAYIYEGTDIIVREPLDADIIKFINPYLRWNHIINLDNIKHKLKKFIEEILVNYNKNVTKAILLAGPPGTGKTMVLKAVANEIVGPLYPIYINGYELKFKRNKAKYVLEKFFKAKRNIPSIIFIENMEVLASSQDLSGDTTDILSELKSLLDNIEGVYIIATTNKLEKIDSSIKIKFNILEIPKLDGNARRELLALYLRDLPICRPMDVDRGFCREEDVVNLDKLVELTEGYTAGDLLTLIRTAFIITLTRAIENNSINLQNISIENIERALKITMHDFLKAVNRIKYNKNM